MTDVVKVALIGAIPGIIAAIGTTLNMLKLNIVSGHTKDTQDKMKELADNTNSKMDKLLLVTGESEHAKGVIEGKRGKMISTSTNHQLTPVIAGHPRLISSTNIRYALIAACMMHVEGYYSTNSLAFKNKNPGNIEYPDGEFIVYPNIIDGFYALVNDIALNKGKTLSQFISKYAPPSQNNTEIYLSVVSELSGVGEGEVI